MSQKRISDELALQEERIKKRIADLKQKLHKLEGKLDMLKECRSIVAGKSKDTYVPRNKSGSVTSKILDMLTDAPDGLSRQDIHQRCIAADSSIKGQIISNILYRLRSRDVVKRENDKYYLVKPKEDGQNGGVWDERE